MSPDEERPIVENEVPKADVPLTKEEFAAQMQQLTERARAAGLNPLRAMFQTYARQGRATLEGILASLESDDSPKKKKA